MKELTIKAKVNEEDMKSAFENMLKTFILKNKKYGNSFETSLDKYGNIAALTRISDKFNRFENLILSKDLGTTDETIIDNLFDMANYCVMTAIYMENSGGINNEQNI